MGELINGRTPEEIKRELRWAAFTCGSIDCEDCEYYESICSHTTDERLAPDALALIELLVCALRDALDKQPKWISVEEELPMVGQLVLTYLGGYTGDVMKLCSLDEFGGWVTDMRIAEDAPITHWMPQPKPPEETNEHGRTKD